MAGLTDGLVQELTQVKTREKLQGPTIASDQRVTSFIMHRNASIHRS